MEACAFRCSASESLVSLCHLPFLLAMVAPAQLSTLLVQHLPAFEQELPDQNRSVASLPELLKCFAAYTRQVALKGRLPQLRACLILANQLLQLDDAALTAAILHVYLPALHLSELPQDPQLLDQFMPGPLCRAAHRL